MTDLAGLLAGLAEAQRSDDPALVAHGEGDVIEYRRGARAFAVTSPGSAEFRLRPDVAEAARRTPDVISSERGPEWVRFGPSNLDRFALDRATAWFEFAWRHAVE